jgi:hypothetical protein
MYTFKYVDFKFYNKKKIFLILFETERIFVCLSIFFFFFWLLTCLHKRRREDLN